MNNTFYYENNLCGLKRADFQKNIGGKETDLFILTNDNGAEMAVTNYGGALLAIMVPDKDGKLANVVQGHDNIESVINSPEPFLSTLIGRYGNRIAKAGIPVIDGCGPAGACFHTEREYLRLDTVEERVKMLTNFFSLL